MGKAVGRRPPALALEPVPLEASPIVGGPSAAAEVTPASQQAVVDTGDGSLWILPSPGSDTTSAFESPATPGTFLAAFRATEGRGSEGTTAMSQEALSRIQNRDTGTIRNHRGVNVPDLSPEAAAAPSVAEESELRPGAPLVRKYLSVLPQNRLNHHSSIALSDPPVPEWISVWVAARPEPRKELINIVVRESALLQCSVKGVSSAHSAYFDQLETATSEQDDRIFELSELRAAIRTLAAKKAAMFRQIEQNHAEIELAEMRAAEHELKEAELAAGILIADLRLLLDFVDNLLHKLLEVDEVRAIATRE
eukprot:SAG31_NODE_1296_length_8945_cov_6.341510_13_plen_309_part_00